MRYDKYSFRDILTYMKLKGNLIFEIKYLYRMIIVIYLVVVEKVQIGIVAFV